MADYGGIGYGGQPYGGLAQGISYTPGSSSIPIACAFKIPGGPSSVDIAIDTRTYGASGVVIRINTRQSGSSFVTIRIGPHTGSSSVPIGIRTRQAGGPSTIPIAIYGNMLTAAAASALVWQPYVVLDGTDISGRITGAIRLEFEETGAPIAEFSFAPTAGAIDPLAYVGKSVTINFRSIVSGAVAWTRLAFTGIVNTPAWDANDRVLAISATGDLQQQLDAMTKAQIRAHIPDGTHSEYVFDAEEATSGWEYAQDLISTTDQVIWQDAGGGIRTTSILAKGSADYTLDDGDIISDSIDWQPAERSSLLNEYRIKVQHRFRRRRQRHITVNFYPSELLTPTIYLSGNLGGWALPQRAQIESAAQSGGWTVIGDINYRDVWPSGVYQTYSDMGTPMWTAWINGPTVTGAFCIGASWRAGRRWLQTITEEYSLKVYAPDSQSAVGVLASDALVAVESEGNDPQWESSLEYDGTVSGAALMDNGVDYKDDLDDKRDELETAQAVVLAVARNAILKSHRDSAVRFSMPYQPMLDLSHTILLDTDYLTAKGKVRRLVHDWDVDSGEVLTHVELALSRRNASGTASDDALDVPDTPDDPAEDAPSNLLQCHMYIGGQDDRPSWASVSDQNGYFVNLPNNGLWSRHITNPQVAARVYQEGFSLQYPDIDEDYVDPATTSGTAEYVVDVPEDTLTITA